MCHCVSVLWYICIIVSIIAYSGLLNPLDAPHHLRATDWSNYREGVTSKKPIKEGRGSFVDIGLQKVSILLPL